MRNRISKKQVEYKHGKYFQGILGELYRIIYDSDRGYAILNMEEGTVDSDFYESLDDFLKYTTIQDMKPVVQTTIAEFEVSLT